MTSSKPPLRDGRIAETPTTGHGWDRREVDIISRRMAGGPRDTVAHDPASTRAPARLTVAARPRSRLRASQVVALAALGFALLAFVVGALSATGGRDTSPPRVAVRPPADAGRAVPGRSASETDRSAETAGQPEAGADLADREMAGEPVDASGATGEAVVRAFYGALGRGDGTEASSLVIPEKRGSQAFSARAISRFYGGLSEPLRLTAITPLAPDVYRVSYRYSAGRTRCDGAAVVRLASRTSRDLIRSIQALNGC